MTKFLTTLALILTTSLTLAAQDITNIGDIKVIADNDSDNNGAVLLQTKLIDRLKVRNDGKIHVFTKLGINSSESDPSALIDFGVTNDAVLLSVSADDQPLKFELVKQRHLNGAQATANHTLALGWNPIVSPGVASLYNVLEGNWCPTPNGECFFEAYAQVVTASGVQFRPWGGQVGKQSGYTSWHEVVNERSISGKDNAGFSLSMSAQGVSLSKAGGYVSLGDNLQVGGGSTPVRFTVDGSGKVHLGSPGNNTPYFQYSAGWLEFRDGFYFRGVRVGGFAAHSESGVQGTVVLSTGLRIPTGGDVGFYTGSNVLSISPSVSFRLLEPGVLKAIKDNDPSIPATVEAKIKSTEVQVFFPGIGYRTVTVGSPDSAGVGFRILQIAN